MITDGVGASQASMVLPVGSVLTTSPENFHGESSCGIENKLFTFKGPLRQANIFTNISMDSLLSLPYIPFYKNICISLLMTFKRIC